MTDEERALTEAAKLTCEYEATAVGGGDADAV